MKPPNGERRKPQNADYFFWKKNYTRLLCNRTVPPLHTGRAPAPVVGTAAITTPIEGTGGIAPRMDHLFPYVRSDSFERSLE
ncbi:MAG: hypothetical protein IPF83_00885 [Rhodanobacteraceae bacterium]|nr:hypothetical protein [Rhodanobacteraceae bacterium]MBP9155293.1 hypothetical protein [Xanthomonadales bacterium]